MNNVESRYFHATRIKKNIHILKQKQFQQKCVSGIAAHSYSVCPCVRACVRACGASVDSRKNATQLTGIIRRSARLIRVHVHKIPEK
jgi:hypothetical protein